jgi:hypothetical protein
MKGATVNGVVWLRGPARLPVLYAADLPECSCCGEPWCPECGKHYWECAHPGPMSEEDE